jgi:prepilin-type N-terminal cleavage/methylation domain-containing protein/prepilin-type processing-associated H-X9-DG protein
MRLRSRGFTLIELLVVIAIIAILAAILFPVFARAREMARKASCTSNLKQVALGVGMYAQDYDEVTPPNFWDGGTGVPAYAIPFHQRTMAHMIQPYTKNVGIFRCPSVTPGGLSPSTPGATYVQIQGNTYSYNNFAANTPLANIQFPADTFIAMDGNSTWSDTCQNGARLCFRHSEQGNFAYVDGHVKSMKSRTPKPSNWFHTKTAMHGDGAACTGETIQWPQVPVTTCIPQ